MRRKCACCTDTTAVAGVLGVLGVLILALLPTCGDDASETGGGTEPPVVLTLLVQSPGHVFPEPPWYWNLIDRFPHSRRLDLALRNAPLALEPVADVRVALERADGTPLGEADSNAEGLVVFEVPAEDWPENVTVSATGYNEDYAMHSLVGIDRPSSADPAVLTIDRRWADPPERITVQGTANRSQSSSYLNVYSSAPYGGRSTNRQSNAWALETPVNTPFDLIAIEYTSTRESEWHRDYRFHSLARVSCDGGKENVVVDIDFATDAAATRVSSGSVRLPEREGSLLRDRGALPNVISVGGSSFWSGTLGWATEARLNDSTVDYTVEQVDMPDPEGIWYLCYVRADASFGVYGGPMSLDVGRGLPAGEQPQLLDLPEWISEVRHPAGYPIDQPLSWEIFDEGVRQSIWIFTGEDVLWVLDVPEDTASVTLPAPPSNVTLAGLLGASPSAVIAIEREIDSEVGVFWQGAGGYELRLDLGE